MAGNIFDKLYRGSGAGRGGSYLNPESQWTQGDSGYDSFEPIYGAQPEAQPELSPREFARSFDPTSNKDVFKLQGMLGLQEDGILGPKTLAALRGLQGAPVEGEGDSGYDSYGTASNMNGTASNMKNAGIFRDQTGFFQGGKEGRIFGRGRDKVGGLLNKAKDWLSSEPQ
jgi:hypothetical protein